MQRLETCLVIAGADRVLCHLVMFETVFFYLVYKMKYSCYQDCSVIHGWFVYYFCGARSKGFATLRNVTKLPFFDKIGQTKSVGFRFYSAI